MQWRSGKLADNLRGLTQGLPAGLERRQQSTDRTRNGLFFFHKHATKCKINMSRILGAIHPHKMAYWPRVRAESNVRGHTTGENHHAQFIEHAIRAVAN